jgi:hypothetical protein
MTVQPDAVPIGRGGLRELPLTALHNEFDRLEGLLAQRVGRNRGVGGRDLAAVALRERERAIVAEIRRRPGGTRSRPARRPAPDVVPPS